MSEFLTIEEIAGALGVSKDRAYKLVAAGRVPAVVIAGRRRVPRQAWTSWIDQQIHAALENTVRGNEKAVKP